MLVAMTFGSSSPHLDAAVAGTSLILSTDNSIQCTPQPSSARSSNHTGLIVGLAVGIPVGLLLLAAALFWFLQTRRKRGRGAAAKAVLPISSKGGDAALTTGSATPHDSGNSGQTSYTNGSGTLKLATQQPQNGSSSGGAALAAEQQKQQQGGSGGGLAGTVGSGVIPPLTGSEMQSVARLRINDTLEVSRRRGCRLLTSVRWSRDMSRASVLTFEHGLLAQCSQDSHHLRLWLSRDVRSGSRASHKHMLTFQLAARAHKQAMGTWDALEITESASAMVAPQFSVVPACRAWRSGLCWAKAPAVASTEGGGMPSPLQARAAC